MPENPKKNSIPERELETLKFWQGKKIFEKSLNKPAPKGEFVFFEGPPTANGKPGIHHLEARAFKDAIPRYKTMQGFHVSRKGGWDTHGLPVELAVEKQLGLKSKKEIESYGIAAFNERCRESVWTYVKEWEEFTHRIGYWIDLKRPYVTYKPYYIESVWNIVSHIHDKGLLYKDYKVVPWCPRCGTGLSSHELAQGYQDVKDLSVTVKFKVKSEKLKAEGGDTYLLAWTTTPWTLPGNVGLAVGKDIQYVRFYKKSEPDIFCVASLELFRKLHGNIQPKDTNPDSFIEYELVNSYKGSELVGLEYEPLYPFLRDNLPKSEQDKLKNALKVYAADFVTTTDGTGIVHTAVMYGQDDFELGTKVGLPKYHLVNEDGTFKPETGFLAGKFVKDEAVAVDIIKDLANRPTGSLLFAKEKYEHSYPHCWRCKTPLIYYARDSWYIEMSALDQTLLDENKDINWEPAYIKDGRFGEWLKDVKDWAISRERYWGTPLPIWECSGCEKRTVVGSFADLHERATDKKLTRLILLRHGESEKNVRAVFDSARDKYPLTATGREKAVEAGEKLKDLKISALYTSPVLRARETAEIVGAAVGQKPVLSDALWEVRSGRWDGQTDSINAAEQDRIAYNTLPHEGYYAARRGETGESWQDVETRMVGFVREILTKHKGETVTIVSHEGPLMTLMRYLKGLSLDEVTNLWEESRSFHKGLLGGYAEPTVLCVDSQTGKEIDPHRPFIDDVLLSCDCGGTMKRVKEVMDVWLDSGAMPFAQEHYPFRNRELIDSGRGYPADFISEAIDQTRGWFYTLHAIGALVGKGKAYKNVICLGHILDAQGKKMSKSLGNIVDPWTMMDKYGADALRLFMYSVNQPGESKNFDEKTVDEIVKKFFNLLSNVLAFYELYKADVEHASVDPRHSPHVLDQWIVALQDTLVEEMTARLDSFQLFEPVRALRDFIADLSQWYLRRSRERFKGEDVEDKKYALATIRYVLENLAKLLAPFAPFFAEHLYRSVDGEKESVHLESWPEVGQLSSERTLLLAQMLQVRNSVSQALELRAKSNIKVRQPLSFLFVNTLFARELFPLLRDEVNVKDVVYKKDQKESVLLDTVITPELKEEGDLREFTRAIQELRKEMKLNPGDLAELVVETDNAGKTFVTKYEKEISKTVQLKSVAFADVVSGAPVSLSKVSFKVSLKKYA